jgi:hypothetical protein
LYWRYSLQSPKLALSIFVILPLFALSLMPTTTSQTDALTLEAEQNWDTYGVGGTCTYNTQNLFVGDVDEDGVVEIVTVGCSALLGNCDPDMRIWSLPFEPLADSNYLPISTVTVAIVLLVAVSVFYIYQRRAKEPNSI